MDDMQMKKPRMSIPVDKRLLSLRNGRNLTLTPVNSTPPKHSRGRKAYVPNLNVVRSKNKETELAKKVIERNKKERSFQQKKREQDDNRFVQQQSTFSEGAGELRKRIHHYESGGGVGGGGTSDLHRDGGMVVPKLEKSDWNIDEKQEANVIDGLLNGRNSNSMKNKSREYHPIILPLSANNEPFLSKFSFESNQASRNSKSTKVSGDCDMHEDDNVAPMFLSDSRYNVDNLHLSLIRLPESFAARVLYDDPAGRSAPEATKLQIPQIPPIAPSASATQVGLSSGNDSGGLGDSSTADSKLADSSQQTDFNCRQFPHEGQIGRVVVRASGAVEVHIGDYQYRLEQQKMSDVGSEDVGCRGGLSYAADVMALPTSRAGVNAGQEAACATVLGAVNDVLTLTPGWGDLFDRWRQDERRKREGGGGGGLSGQRGERGANDSLPVEVKREDDG